MGVSYNRFIEEEGEKPRTGLQMVLHDILASSWMVVSLQFQGRGGPGGQ